MDAPTDRRGLIFVYMLYIDAGKKVGPLVARLTHLKEVLSPDAFRVFFFNYYCFITTSCTARLRLETSLTIIPPGADSFLFWRPRLCHLSEFCCASPYAQQLMLFIVKIIFPETESVILWHLITLMAR